VRIAKIQPLPLFHATVNTVGAGLVFPMFKGADVIRLWWIYAVLWALVAAGFAVFSQHMKPRPKLAAVTV
jgi:hypothetical protein